MEQHVSMIQLPGPVKGINWFGKILEKVGSTPIQLHPEKLLKQAQKQTGLQDFGGEDFLEPLHLLLEDHNKEKELSLLGRIIVKRELGQILKNRLLIQETFNKHPEIHEVKIEKPVFILGFPRTGTTLLHNLMAQNERARTPKMWELHAPCPPPSPETPSNDPRIVKMKKDVKQMFEVVPVLQAIHPMGAERPDECFPLFHNCFASLTFGAESHVPRYMEWLKNKDLVPDYQYYRKQLQILQWKFPNTFWVLKAPSHLLGLKALLKVFPDAKIIQTHRTPQEVVASCCSLYEATRTLFTKQPKPEAIGEQWLKQWGNAMDHTMQVRKEVDGSNFYDLHYRSFVSDPVGTIKKLHTHFSLPYDQKTEDKVAAWLKDNPSNKHGVHKYTLERYGLTETKIKERFIDYIETFLA